MQDTKLPKGFFYFISTLTLGAFNDNIFKYLILTYGIFALNAGTFQFPQMDQEEIAFWLNLIFTLPFVLFGSWSGYLGDKYAKSTVMKTVKYVEVGVMLLGVFAFYTGSFVLMCMVLGFMATQSAFFSPAKYGYIPEVCPPTAISNANGWMEMTTFTSIIFGVGVTGVLFDLHEKNAYVVSFYCVGIAIIGLLTSWFMPATQAKGAKGTFPWEPLSGMIKNVYWLSRKKELFMAALANSYFWALGLVFQTNTVFYGAQSLQVENATLLLVLPAFMGLGIATGSMFAGYMSRGKVELGLVPFGGFGMAMVGMILYFTTGSYWVSVFFLFASGFFGGFFVVPLYAYMQYTAEDQEKGKVLAIVGILNGLFLLLGTAVHFILGSILDLSPDVIFFILGIITLCVVYYMGKVVPTYLIRFLSWMITSILYRITVNGQENIPLRKPALLVSNHVSMVDAFLVNTPLQRLIKFAFPQRYFQVPFVGMMCRIMEVIPIQQQGDTQAIEEVTKELKVRLAEGKCCCIFPEGYLTKDGKMQPFHPAFEKMIENAEYDIIPVYIDNVWGSIFSLEGGRAYWKFPKSFRRPVTVTYGTPIQASSILAVENAVKNLGESTKKADAMQSNVAQQ